MNPREFLTILSSSTNLMIRMLGMYTRYYFARRSAVRAFKDELMSYGISRETAEELSRFYPDLRKITV
ncbi:hypothetical protein FJY84_06885 [Candidatus Bathyarchaeota archaeon]|nr:hypothetical protein [Candidatus Bathyarchaeota archaeon]